MITTPFLLTLCLITQAPRQAQALSVKDVLDRWEAGSRLIETYDLSIELKSEGFCVSDGGAVRLVRPGESNPPSFFYSHVFRSGDKRYGEFTTVKDDFRDRKLLFDGASLTVGSLPQNEYQIQQYCNLFGATQLEDYEALYRTVLGTADRIAISREREARLLPQEGNFYVLNVPAGKVAGPLGEIAWKVYLDSTRNFMPAKLSEFLVKSGLSILSSDCTIELAEVAPGVWAPVGADFSIFGKNSDSPIFGKKMGAGSLRVDRKKSRFNIAIPADQFVLKIPDGATVTDRTRNVVYTQGASNPDAYLASLAKQGQKAANNLPNQGAMGQMPLIVPDEPFFWSRGRVAAFGLAVVVVGVLANVSIKRRARRLA